MAEFCDRILVADHMSTDHTPELLRELSRELDHVEVRRIAHSAKSHDLIENLAGTDRTADEIANEAIQKYVDAQEAILGLRSFVAENRKDMLKRGLTKRDVMPMIKEYRKEKRER